MLTDLMYLNQNQNIPINKITLHNPLPTSVLHFQSGPLADVNADNCIHHPWFTQTTSSGYFVDSTGIEPVLEACKAPMLTVIIKSPNNKKHRNNSRSGPYGLPTELSAPLPQVLLALIS